MWRRGERAQHRLVKEGLARVFGLSHRELVEGGRLAVLAQPPRARLPEKATKLEFEFRNAAI